MADVIRYIDPTATGLGDGTSWTDAYTTIDAWHTAEATDLVTAGDTHTVYCRRNGGGEDTSSISTSSWTTDATNYLKIAAADGDQCLKSGWDDTRFVWASSGGSTPITVRDEIIIDGIQFEGDTDTSYIFNFTANATTDTVIRNCRMRNTSSATGTCFYFNYSTSAKIENCVIRDFNKAVENNSTAGPLVYNNTIIDCSLGVHQDNTSGTTTIVNNALVNSSTWEENGTITSNYNASSDGYGTNPVTITDWSTIFNDYANGDVTVLDTATEILTAGLGPDADANCPATRY